MDKFGHITGSKIKQYTLADPIDQFGLIWGKKDPATLSRAFYWKEEYGHMRLVDFNDDFFKSAIGELRVE